MMKFLKELFRVIIRIIIDFFIEKIDWSKLLEYFLQFWFYLKDCLF